MNLDQELKSTEEKVFAKVIQNSEKIKIIGLALSQNQILAEHKTSIPTTLLVLKGQLNFSMKSETYTLNALETFEIPVNEMHSVKGIMAENTFILIQEKQ